jgi:hypothetical protein
MIDYKVYIWNDSTAFTLDKKKKLQLSAKHKNGNVTDSLRGNSSKFA